MVQIYIAPLAGERASKKKKYTELHAPVCLVASGIVHLALGEEMLLKEHELFIFFVPAGCGWDLRAVNANVISTQNAFLTSSSVAAERDVIELKKFTISINYNNSYYKKDLFYGDNKQSLEQPPEGFCGGPIPGGLQDATGQGAK